MQGKSNVNSLCHERTLYVRGGGWRLTVTNFDNIDCVVTMYSGFCRDGTDYVTMAGDVNVPWSPYIAIADVGKRYRIGKWKKDFVLHKGPDNWGETQSFTFRIGSFPIDVSRFISDKKGWPFIWITWRCVKQWHCKLQFELESMIPFTDNNPHGMTDQELRDLAIDLKALKENIYATGDAAMNTA